MQEYPAEKITVLNDLKIVRQKYDLNALANNIKSWGDINRLAKNLKINRCTLSRAIAEAKILSLFPTITKAKVVSLTTLKTLKEKSLFSEKYDINRLSCRAIYKLIKEWKNLIEKNPRVLLTDEQHDLIVGSILGDANIRLKSKNCSFRVTHSKNQERYLYWKYGILKEFTTRTPIYPRKTEINGYFLETLNLSTFTHHVFNFYYDILYKNGKKTITREILNMLTPRSLAIWICDDGSFSTKQHYIILCTNSYSLEEHKIMKEYFKEILGLSPTIGFRDNKYYYLRFKQEDTKRLINIIKPFIPAFIKYKIGEKNE